MSSAPKKFFIIAGESSGDFIGAKLISALQNICPETAVFSGIGGRLMTEQGLKSLFPMQDLSLMGIWEILPKIRFLRKRLEETRAALLAFQPDAVITIDSPGFAKALARILPEKGYRDWPFIHYVAPSVWAWRPGRVHSFARLFDAVLALFPFEPPYFANTNLPCTFVGHPLLDRELGEPDIEAWRKEQNIGSQNIVLSFLPGSRTGEIQRMLPVMSSAWRAIHKQYPDVVAVVIAAPGHETSVTHAIADWPGKVICVDITQRDKVFAASKLAIATSGTVTLELGLAKTPHIILYRMHPFNAWLARHLVNLDRINLINMICNQNVIPVYLQKECNSQNITKVVESVFQNGHLILRQQKFFAQLPQKMMPGQGQSFSPALRAAQEILRMLSPQIQEEL